ncbi:MAG: hypothetical protein HC850_04720 [Rhodomicrobium sp.]|nr:hypothetical protein [Rhodomicrobium sp.]
MACLPAKAFAQSNDSFCRNYATESVEMQSLNLEYNCGYTGLRWHTWWEVHFGWCRDWAERARVQEEAVLRRVQIERCSRDNGREYRRGDR